MTAPQNLHEEQREALERAGELLAVLVARRWLDKQAALAAQNDDAAPPSTDRQDTPSR